MPLMRTFEFVYYVFWVGVLIATLHLSDVRPWMEWFRLVIIPIVIGFSVWFFASYSPMRE